MPLEIAVDSAEDAAACVGVADRLELCRDLSSHGLTPAPALVREVRELAAAPVVVLIRPSVALTPSPADVLEMERQIGACLEAGADAFAFGALDDRMRVDSRLCRRLVRSCSGRAAVFHRAFDFARDRQEALDAIIDVGIARVLTAGVASFDHSAAHLSARLASIHALVERARGRVGIVACGGIRSHNARGFTAVTGEIHSACRTVRPGNPAAGFDRAEAAALKSVLAAGASGAG